jgi:hypothetical protein
MKGWKLDLAKNTTPNISVPSTFIHLQTNHNTNILLYWSINKYYYLNPARNITNMSPEHSTFAPSLLDDSVKEDPCKDLGAASLARPFTKKQQYEFNNVGESRGYEFRDRRQAMDLVKWVNVRVDNQKKLVGKSDMSKYLVYEQETKTMTQEAQECYDPKFKYGTLAEAMVGEQGTENSFRIST